jgi:FkbM family methyltransferase
MVPVELIRPGWTCYSVGTGGDVSFDAELIRRFDVRVRSFDPVRYFVDRAAAEMRDEPRFSAHCFAITDHDGPILMQRSHHPGARAVSAAALFDTDEWDVFAGRSLPSLMEELGDGEIDLLKMDTEGTEYELLPSLELPALGVKVLALCLHHNRSVGEACDLIASLQSAGYEAVARCPAVRLTFVHRSLLALRPRAGVAPGGPSSRAW